MSGVRRGLLMSARPGARQRYTARVVLMAAVTLAFGGRFALDSLDALAHSSSYGTIAGGGAHTLAVRLDGSVWAWGSNEAGQLGIGNRTGSTTPVQVVGAVGIGTLSGITAVAAGTLHSLALASSGAVWAWGDNTAGQLGDGAVSLNSCNTGCSNTPVQVAGLGGVKAVAAAGFTSYGLKSDGTVWAWGDNGDGGLGDGTVTTPACGACSDFPVQVSGLTGVIAIAAMDRGGAMALEANGTVWDWGDNVYGQLGVGTSNGPQMCTEPCSRTPVQVSSLSGVKAIAGGSDVGLALKSDGTVWDWGDNQVGELGNGTVSTTGCACSDVPVQVSGLASVSSIGAGDGQSLALEANGTVWSWGENGNGQLGNGTTGNGNNQASYSDVPVLVSGLGGVTALAGGEAHSLALEANGTVWTWGLNRKGQLGNGTTTASDTPVLSEMVGGAQPPLALLPPPPPAVPVLLIHGAPGSSGTAGGDNGTDWNTLANFLNARGLPTQTEGYYYNDTNMNDWLDFSDRPALCYGSNIYNNGNGPSDNPGDGEMKGPNGPSHDSKADFRHLAFELAWRIHDLYGTSNVMIVADSMGGLIVRWMLYQLNNPEASCPYPGQLSVSNVVAMDTPNNGANLATLGPNFEDSEMVGNSPGNSFLSTLNNSSSGLAPQASNGTNWTVAGSLSDGFVAWTSQLYMGTNDRPVHAVLFEGTTSNCSWDQQTYNAEVLGNPVFAGDPCTYAHGGMKLDSSTAMDAEAEWNSQWTHGGTSTGWDTVPGNSQDPFSGGGSTQWHGDLLVYKALTDPAY